MQSRDLICHRDMCFPGMRVSRTHIPRDMCARNTHPWETHIPVTCTHQLQNLIILTVQLRNTLIYLQVKHIM